MGKGRKRGESGGRQPGFSPLKLNIFSFIFNGLHDLQRPLPKLTTRVRFPSPAPYSDDNLTDEPGTVKLTDDGGILVLAVNGDWVPVAQSKPLIRAHVEELVLAAAAQLTSTTETAE